MNRKGQRMCVVIFLFYKDPDTLNDPKQWYFLCHLNCLAFLSLVYCEHQKSSVILLLIKVAAF